MLSYRRKVQGDHTFDSQIKKFIQILIRFELQELYP
jgi:hypothetical protein